jgi:hypothetical protein
VVEVELTDLLELELDADADEELEEVRVDEFEALVLVTLAELVGVLELLVVDVEVVGAVLVVNVVPPPPPPLEGWFPTAKFVPVRTERLTVPDIV